jgi:hypothetical protein
MPDQAMDDAAAQAIADTGTDSVVSNDTAVSPDGSSSPDASGATPQADATTFNPELYAFEHKGQRILPKDENQVRQWLSGGYNFSQNQAEFKKQQTEFQARQAKVAELERLNEAFEKNPLLQKEIFALLQKTAQPQVPGQPPAQMPVLPPEIQAKLEKLDTVTQDVQRMKEKEEDQALDQEVSGLKAKHPEFDWQSDAGEGTLEKQVLQAAMDHGLNDLEKAFRLVTYDKLKTNTEAAVLKRLADERQANIRAGVVATTGAPQKVAPKPVSHQDMTYTQLAQMAQQELGITN